MIGVDQKSHFNQFCLVESIASYMFCKNSSHCYYIILLHQTVASFFFICFVLLMHENYFQFHFSVEQLWISYSSSIMIKGTACYISTFFAMKIITMIREETLRYARSKNNHSFDHGKRYHEFLGHTYH